MVDVISKKEAIRNGLHKYFTGIACKHGHISERYVSHGGCLQCIDIRRNVSENTKLLRADKIVREKSKQNGEFTYVSVKPCFRGHHVKYSETRICVECSRERREKHNEGRRIK